MPRTNPKKTRVERQYPAKRSKSARADTWKTTKYDDYDQSRYDDLEEEDW